MAFSIVIIDGQGGKLGKELVEKIRLRIPEAEITAVGTNSAATAAMMKAGASHSATGENAVAVAARNADIIMGPVGIVIADSLFGEITPLSALSVAQSRAKKILIPFNKCDIIIPGVTLPFSELINAAVDSAAAEFR